MDVNVKQIEIDSARTLEDLYRAYVHEMAPYFEPSSKSTDATHQTRTLRKYWNNKGHWAYLIYSSKEIAGFCLVRHYPDEFCTHDIEQFYISEAFKRQGIGRSALRQVLKAHPGDWLVRVLEENERALLFWHQAIRGCVGGRYTHGAELDDGLEMHFIRFEWTTFNNRNQGNNFPLAVQIVRCCGR